MKHSITALFVALFALGSLTVFAQQDPAQQDPAQQERAGTPGQEMDIQSRDFDELDADSDGQLTQSEAQQAGLEPVAFQALDEDGNQQVSKDEFEQAKER